MIVWRFTGHRLLAPAAGQRAQKLVAVQFLLLAPYVSFEAVQHLVTGQPAETSVLGMALTVLDMRGPRGDARRRRQAAPI